MIDKLKAWQHRREVTRRVHGKISAALDELRSRGVRERDITNHLRRMRAEALRNAVNHPADSQARAVWDRVAWHLDEMIRHRRSQEIDEEATELRRG